MSNGVMKVGVPAKEASMKATIVRADGTRVELGTVAYWHKNPIKRLIWRIKRWVHLL